MLIVEPNLDFKKKKTALLVLLFYANERKCDQLDLTSPIVIALGMGYRMPKHPLRFGQADQDLMILNQLYKSFCPILATI